MLYFCFIQSQTNHGHISYCYSDSGAEKNLFWCSHCCNASCKHTWFERVTAKAYLQGPLRFQRLDNVLLNKVLEFFPYPVTLPSFTKRSPHTQQVLARLLQLDMMISIFPWIFRGFESQFSPQLSALCPTKWNSCPSMLSFFSFPWPGLWIQSSVAEDNWSKHLRARKTSQMELTAVTPPAWVLQRPCRVQPNDLPWGFIEKGSF